MPIKLQYRLQYEKHLGNVVTVEVEDFRSMRDKINAIRQDIVFNTGEVVRGFKYVATTEGRIIESNIEEINAQL